MKAVLCTTLWDVLGHNSDLQVIFIVNKEEQRFLRSKSSPPEANVKRRWVTSQNCLSVSTKGADLGDQLRY